LIEIGATGSAGSRLQKEGIMPITTILVLFGIVLSFVVFGVVLAWADYQTRDLNRGSEQTSARDDHQDMKKAA
jgi:hypothetical protein